MKRGSLSSDGKMSFSFRPTFTSPAVKVEWKGDIAFFDENLARLLVDLGYADLPTAEQVGEVNEAIETAEAPTVENVSEVKAANTETLTTTEQSTKVNENKAPNDKPKGTRKEQTNDSKADLPTAEQVGEVKK